MAPSPLNIGRTQCATAQVAVILPLAIVIAGLIVSCGRVGFGLATHSGDPGDRIEELDDGNSHQAGPGDDVSGDAGGDSNAGDGDGDISGDAGGDSNADDGDGDVSGDAGGDSNAGDGDGVAACPTSVLECGTPADGCPPLFACASLDALLEGPTLPAWMTYQRASEASYMRQGRLVMAGANEPRFPTDLQGEPQGLFVEGAAANYIERSSDFGAWSPSELEVREGAALAPDGAGTGTEITATTADVVHTLTLSCATMTAEAAAASVFVKPLRDDQAFYLRMDGTGGWKAFWFVPETRAFGFTGSIGAATLTFESLEDGWYRIGIGGTYALAGDGPSMTVGIVSTEGTAVGGMQDWPSAVAGDGAPGFLIWGAQVETTMYTTSHLPTSGGVAHRAADQVSLDAGGWLTGRGTLLVEGVALDRSESERALVVGTSTSEPQHSIVMGISGLKGIAVVENAPSTATAADVGGAWPADARQRCALTMAAAGWRFACNGFVSDLVPATVRTSTVDLLQLGAAHATAQAFSGTIHRLTYWPQEMSADLDAAVTLAP